MPSPLIDTDYCLQRMPGKGGWTYIEITEFPPEKRRWLTRVKLTGAIDAYVLQQQSVMPMSNGHLFLPVKKEIRTLIGKEAGEWVRLVLYAPAEVAADATHDFLLCLEEEPLAQTRFNHLNEKAKKELLEWLHAAQTDEERVQRIADCIENLLRQQ